MRYNVKFAFVLLSAVVIWSALGIQFHFFMLWAKNHNASVFGGLWSFLSFFTNLSNLLAGIALTYVLSTRCDSSRLKQKSGLYAAIALYICMASIIFNLELSQTIPRNGPTYLVNILLHDVTPLLFLAFWAIWVPYCRLTLKNCLVWIAFPILYFAHVMARGGLIGQYPYAFFNPKLLGYQTVLVNGLEMLAGFFCVSLVFIGLDWLKRRFVTQ